jgi:hypothetical protein
MSSSVTSCGEIFITRFSAWAPGIESSAQWNEWAHDKLQITTDAKGPDISFTEPMFRRRLSQLSKMTVQVIHDILPLENDTKIFFLSFRGELSRQYQINKMLIEENALMPAAFSLSVFNAPAALASIAFGLKGGYSAVYPRGNSFSAGLVAAKASLLCGNARELVFVYADEQLPPEYNCFHTAGKCTVGILPLAFAFLLSRENISGSVPFSFSNEDNGPADFLKKLLISGEIHVSS